MACRGGLEYHAKPLRLSSDANVSLATRSKTKSFYFKKNTKEIVSPATQQDDD
jgi:hypothetical protein